jgi:hypothetical protein
MGNVLQASANKPENEQTSVIRNQMLLETEFLFVSTKCCTNKVLSVQAQEENRALL